MIYILAVLLPPLALLLNGQPFAAIGNVVLIVVSFVLGFLFLFTIPILFLLPSLHAVIAIAMRRKDRRHREMVDAVERHGSPPGWRP